MAEAAICRQQSMDAVHVVNTLWAFSKLRRLPGGAALQALTDATAARAMCDGSTYEPKNISNVLMATGRLRQLGARGGGFSLRLPPQHAYGPGRHAKRGMGRPHGELGVMHTLQGDLA